MAKEFAGTLIGSAANFQELSKDQCLSLGSYSLINGTNPLNLRSLNKLMMDRPNQSSFQAVSKLPCRPRC